MRAVVVDRYGRNAPVRHAEIPVPVVGERDVLVRIHAAGVNPLDTKIRDGEFRVPLPYRVPFVLGNDLAGVVDRIGSAVRRFRVGDEVYARPDKDRIGTFAEYLAVDEADLAPSPTGLTMAEASSLPLVALTAWQALVESADVRPGHRVLIHAGSGGVGTIAIQLAKHLGAHVTTTAGAANVDLVRGLGADDVVDHRAQRFDEVVRDQDVVLDPLGPQNVLRSLRVLRPGGLVVGIGGPPDPPFARYLEKPLLRPVFALTSRTVRSSARKLGVRYRFLFMRASGEQLREVAALVDAGVIRPVIDRTYAFDDTADALAYVDSGRARGKVVVTLG